MCDQRHNMSVAARVCISIDDADQFRDETGTGFCGEVNKGTRANTCPTCGASLHSVTAMIYFLTVATLDEAAPYLEEIRQTLNQLPPGESDERQAWMRHHRN
jgi:hypothetical protein